MDVGLFHPGARDAHELGLGAHVVDGRAAGQPHGGAQAAHLLVNDLFQAAFIGHAAFDHDFVDDADG